MIVLTQSGGETLRLTLGSALNVDYSFFYIDTSDTPGLSRGTLGSTTPTDIVSAPGSGQRMIKSGFIHNRDSSPVIVDIQVYATTGRKQVKYTIPADGSLFYEDGSGWFPFNNTSSSPVMFESYRATSTQSVNSTTYTKVQLNGETFDSNGYFDNASNYRFTPLVSGKYKFNWTVAMVSLGANKNLYSILCKNGAPTGSIIAYGSLVNSGASGDAVSTGSKTVTMNGSTDYVEIYVYHDHGSARDVYAGSQLTFFSGFRVGDA